MDHRDFIISLKSCCRFHPRELVFHGDFCGMMDSIVKSLLDRMSNWFSKSSRAGLTRFSPTAGYQDSKIEANSDNIYATVHDSWPRTSKTEIHQL